MLKTVSFAAIVLMGFMMFPPKAEGETNATSGGEAASQHPALEKGSACKDRCFHAEATCRGKRGACMAARQSCLRGCR